LWSTFRANQYLNHIKEFERSGSEEQAVKKERAGNSRFPRDRNAMIV